MTCLEFRWLLYLANATPKCPVVWLAGSKMNTGIVHIYCYDYQIICFSLLFLIELILLHEVHRKHNERFLCKATIQHRRH